MIQEKKRHFHCVIFIGIWACPPLRVGRAFRSSLPLGLLTTVVSTSPSLRSGPLNHRRCGGLLRNCSMPSRCKLAGGPCRGCT